ncbi:hypothetical protein [Nostoc sp. JL33]|uniref:hypothetical protein n=1 Tax=Nostoc sp. JL33 TaxID=2815396 RepID=UPI0025E5B6BF|nr:hypothetical protein [Nostoc sp. JL33]MBN3872879.1 hypothetical protein [Nostoc sp. JL33]
MKTNFRITKFIILSIAASILIPQIAVCTNMVSTASANAGATTSNTSIARKLNSQNLKDDTYIPPNYGGPDSHHGSGTR